MRQVAQSRLGDWGANDRRSPAGDKLIDVDSAAENAAAGEWEFVIHTDGRVSWHVPDTASTLKLVEGNHGWQLKRGKRQIGSRHPTLGGGLDAAAEFMEKFPEGGGRRYA